MKGSLKKVGKVYWLTIDMGKEQIGLDENNKPIFKRIQRRFNTHCEKKPDAEKVQANIINQLNNNEFVFPEKITFSQYLRDWLEKYVKMKCEQTTYEGYKLIIEKHIIPYFKENVLLQKLQPIDLQNYYNYKLTEGRVDGKGKLSVNTIWKHHANIHKALKQAIVWKLIKTNPADGVELPRKKKYEAKFYTEKQIYKLLESVKNTYIETVIYLGALLGLRRGEILGLKWENINFETCEVKIDNTIVRHSGKPIEKKPKNETSERTLIAPKVLIQYLSKLQIKQKANKLQFGNAYNKSGYVCCNVEGNPLDPSDVDHKFAATIDELNFPKIRLHDLRHSNASMLLKLGATMKEVQEWLGHKQLSTTSDIYAHIDQEMKKQSANRIDNLFNKKKKAR